MGQMNPKLFSWVAAHLLPHEASARRWLSSSGISPPDADDLIQEAYCRISSMTSFDQINSPKAYFNQTVRNILVERARRARVVNIQTVAEIDRVPGEVDERSPERIVMGREALAQVNEVLRGLPKRTSDILRMRRVEGMSQKEIAATLRISEAVVEYEAAKAIRLILRHVGRGQDTVNQPKETKRTRRARNG